jgi:hypothetical protein
MIRDAALKWSCTGHRPDCRQAQPSASRITSLFARRLAGLRKSSGPEIVLCAQVMPAVYGGYSAAGELIGSGCARKESGGMMKEGLLRQGGISVKREFVF